mmetsp:Transcript_53247/g.79531  ORF Transcript_53247/g.79531 Transcript_53247/m.79531 type:complete len:143 (-) Transcript_53247:419-847(-)
MLRQVVTGPRTGRFLTKKLACHQPSPLQQRKSAVALVVAPRSPTSSRHLLQAVTYLSSDSKDGISSEHQKQQQQIYLHVGPSGDCWTGTSIFAAKHLQPDYVKSIPLPEGCRIEQLLEQLEDDLDLAQQTYDTGKIPSSLLD